MRDRAGSGEGEGYCGSKGEDEVQRPAACDIVQRSAGGGILLPLAKGKLVDPGRREDLRHVCASWALVVLQSVWILYAAAFHAIPAGAAQIQGFRPCVGDQIGQPMKGPTVQ